MACLARRRRAVNSHFLPLFDWAERNRLSKPHISPLARMVHSRWGYSPELAKAVTEAWGYTGGRSDV